MSTLSIATAPGFARPVDDAQAVFRAVLQALSRPGMFVCLPALPPSLARDEMTQGMLALALALCDQDSPLWLDSAADSPQTRHHLRFHCASPFAAAPEQAAFAFISRPESMPRLSAFHAGRADFPDRSATLVIRVDCSAEAPESEVMEVTGPGVKGNERGIWQAFRLGGLPAWFWTDWRDNQALYPLGVDVIFVESANSGQGAPSVRILGLPRTARVRKAVNAKEGSLCM